MKNMKKLFLSAFALMLAAASYAGQYPSNIIGVRGGMNISTMNRRVALEGGGHISLNDDRRAKVGWNVGVVDQILLLDMTPLYLEPGLYLTNKGSGYRTKNGDVKNIMRLGATYLQIPVNISYHIYVGNFTIQPRLGVYYAVGLWARDIAIIKSEGQIDKTVLNPYDRENTLMGRSDFGMQVGLGATYMEHYYFGFEWETGFVNMSKVPSRKDTNISNFKIEFGYNF